MRTTKDTLTIKELQWALQSLRCSPALNKNCEEAVRFTQQLLNNFMGIVNLTYPYVEVIKWSDDASELNECAMALREEVGLRRENARLLDTAPELLEALKLLAQEVDDLSANNLDGHNWTHHQQLLTLAHTAINKATGV